MTVLTTLSRSRLKNFQAEWWLAVALVCVMTRWLGRAQCWPWPRWSQQRAERCRALEQDSITAVLTRGQKVAAKSGLRRSAACFVHGTYLQRLTNSASKHGSTIGTIASVGSRRGHRRGAARHVWKSADSEICFCTLATSAFMKHIARGTLPHHCVKLRFRVCQALRPWVTVESQLKATVPAWLFLTKAKTIFQWWTPAIRWLFLLIRLWD